jgi:hypothetical protein
VAKAHGRPRESNRLPKQERLVGGQDHRGYTKEADKLCTDERALNALLIKPMYTVRVDSLSFWLALPSVWLDHSVRVGSLHCRVGTLVFRSLNDSAMGSWHYGPRKPIRQARRGRTARADGAGGRHGQTGGRADGTDGSVRFSSVPVRFGSGTVLFVTVRFGCASVSRFGSVRDL